MKLVARIRFVVRIYIRLIPAIWRSWRAGPYAPPTVEDVKAFVSEGDTGFGFKIGPVDTTPSCYAPPPPSPIRPVTNTEVHLNGN